MKHIFKPGDIKVYEKIISGEETAAFHGEEVHPVYATFALARDVEWASRLFVIALKDEDEEGIGTKLEIEHVSPAFVNEKVKIIVQISSIVANEVNCSFTVSCRDRLIARGKSSQKILKTEKIKKIFSSLR